MTSLLAWIAYDSRRATALYLASDSRQTFEDGMFLDNCTKIYVAVAAQNQSEVFGFCGDVTFAQHALKAVCSAIERKDIPLSYREKAESRASWIHYYINEQLKNFSRPLIDSTTILHASRDSWGSRAKFYLHSYSGGKGATILKKKRESLTRRDLYVRNGTGHNQIFMKLLEVRSQVGDFSRAYLAAFFRSLNGANVDKNSGGPVQLAGIATVGDARHYGIVSEGKPFFRGKKATKNLGKVQWFDTKMQRVNSDGSLLKSAKRHNWKE